MLNIVFVFVLLTHSDLAFSVFFSAMQGLLACFTFKIHSLTSHLPRLITRHLASRSARTSKQLTKHFARFKAKANPPTSKTSRTRAPRAPLRPHPLSLSPARRSRSRSASELRWSIRNILVGTSHADQLATATTQRDLAG